MNNTANIILKPNSLWQNLTQQTEHALNYGALESIPTEYELIQYEEIDFLVRILTNLNRKDNAKKQQKKILSIATRGKKLRFQLLMDLLQQKAFQDFIVF